MVFGHLKEEPFGVLADIGLEIQKILPTQEVREGLAGVMGRVEATRDMLIQEGRKAESGVFDSLRRGLLDMDAALANIRQDTIHGVDQLMGMGAAIADGIASSGERFLPP